MGVSPVQSGGQDAHPTIFSGYLIHDPKHREFSVTVYLRIVQGKIWIEEDWTKQGIADQLLEAGVLPEDIVLGFQHPDKRCLTEFATA